MRGGHTAEQVNKYISDQIGMPYDELWRTFVTDCEAMSVADNVLQKLQSLRVKYILILITGNMDSFSRFTVPTLKLDEYFDYISNSYNAGKLKTDNQGKLFLDYVQKYKADIKECYLFDDSERVCEVFSNLGGKVC